RPIRVEWHRQFQTLTEIHEPGVELTPIYQRLVDETKRAPEAVYLLGRTQTGAPAARLYMEAANAPTPSAYACTGLAFRLLARGDVDEALRWSKKGAQLSPEHEFHRLGYLQALIAAGRHQELVNETNKDVHYGLPIPLAERIAAHLALGNRRNAEAE